MTYDVIITDEFEKEIRYYVRKRKCNKLFYDIDKVVKTLENGIFTGDVLKELNNKHTYKVRMVDSSNGLGARGGFRIIYCIKKDTKEVYLLILYHKRDLDDVSTGRVQYLIDKYIK